MSLIIYLIGVLGAIISLAEDLEKEGDYSFKSGGMVIAAAMLWPVLMFYSIFGFLRRL
jgi:hypothetical protein